MDASQYKDYVLVILFIKYISDKYAGKKYAPLTIPAGASFADMVALKGKSDIGDRINKQIIAPLQKANKLSDMPDFNDPNRLGSDKEMVERLSNLIAVFERPALDFSGNRAGDDDLLGDAYEYLMRHFATESGKSKGQFYTPSEVSRVIAQVLEIGSAKTSSDTTVYDPTCGSGSLLLKLAYEANTPITLYGQEREATTANLGRMNMILHDYPTAVIEQGNTISNPKFLDEGELKTFDYVVANPPFSDKRWSSGIDPLNDPHQRFQPYGTPPAKQGDYAFLLHIVRSLKSKGKGACILPHGVLFRGNVEADIRRNLVRKGYIKGIIGLPANLFYGTGIPACIVILDKEEAAARRSIFMIDASAGFFKDGNKNRLRSKDIHRMVSTWVSGKEVPKYSRRVPFKEIEENDYNLNLPRYIDTQAPEDRQDIEAHLKGGIPVADLDDLGRYWEVCPGLRKTLFKANRSGYVDLAVDQSVVRSAILEHPEFVALVEQMNAHFEEWRKASTTRLKKLASGSHPKEIITTLSEDLLGHYAEVPLIDKYDVYQHLMDYWSETMQDDCYIIAADGWKAETYRIVQTDRKGKEKDKGWACDLIPKELVVARFFKKESDALIAIEADLQAAESTVTELEEEHGGDEGILADVSTSADLKRAHQEAVVTYWQVRDPDGHRAYSLNEQRLERFQEQLAKLAEEPAFQDLTNDKGKVPIGSVKKQLKTAKGGAAETLQRFLEAYDEEKSLRTDLVNSVSEQESLVEERLSASDANGDLEDIRILGRYRDALERTAVLKKARKEAEAELDALAYAKYPKLTEAEVKSLVVEDKWMGSLDRLIHREMDRIGQGLTHRIRDLAERYELPLPDLIKDASEMEARVNGHLESMGFAWK
tara:strand:- start:35373 stop:38009 length:2637 start_codon:yes stop_codon:yes gene_type:complete